MVSAVWYVSVKDGIDSIKLFWDRFDMKNICRIDDFNVLMTFSAQRLICAGYDTILVSCKSAFDPGQAISVELIGFVDVADDVTASERTVLELASYRIEQIKSRVSIAGELKLTFISISEVFVNVDTRSRFRILQEVN